MGIAQLVVQSLITFIAAIVGAFLGAFLTRLTKPPLRSVPATGA